MQLFQKLTKETLFFIFILFTLLLLGTVAITALSSDRALIESILLEQPDGAEILADLEQYSSLTPEEAFQLRIDQLRQQQDSGDSDA